MEKRTRCLIVLSFHVSYSDKNLETRLRWRLPPCWRTTPVSWDLATTSPSRVPEPEPPWPSHETMTWVRNLNPWSDSLEIFMYNTRNHLKCYWIVQQNMKSASSLFYIVRQQRLRWTRQGVSRRATISPSEPAKTDDSCASSLWCSRAEWILPN